MIKTVLKVDRVYTDNYKWTVKVTETRKIYFLGILIFTIKEDVSNLNDNNINKVDSAIGFKKL
jgi:hypothetical protein